MIVCTLRRLAQPWCASCQRIGHAAFFLGQLLTQPPKRWRIWRLTLGQLHVLGMQSVIIVVVSALFIGMVMGLQGYHTLQQFGATSQLGPLVALSVFRELGPVVTALLYAGRAGSALTAELGLMQVTQQIDCMEVMAIPPLPRVVFPRFLASILAVPALTALFNAVAVIGGFWVCVHWLGLDSNTFWSNMRQAVLWHDDVLKGLMKSVVFGFFVSWVALYQGYTTQRSAEGMGQAATRTVVYSSVLVLALDFILTAMMLGD